MNKRQELNAMYKDLCKILRACRKYNGSEAHEAFLVKNIVAVKDFYRERGILKNLTLADQCESLIRKRHSLGICKNDTETELEVLRILTSTYQFAEEMEFTDDGIDAFIDFISKADKPEPYKDWLIGALLDVTDIIEKIIMKGAA